MKAAPRKLEWLDRAIQTHHYHVSRLKKDPSWNIIKTAEELNRSKSSIAQDLTIVSWLRTHDDIIRSFDTQQRALTFIKIKKQEIKTRLYDA